MVGNFVALLNDIWSYKILDIFLNIININICTGNGNNFDKLEVISLYKRLVFMCRVMEENYKI